MFKPLAIFVLAASAAAAAAGPPAGEAAPMGPREAIVAAADAAPRGVPGLFTMRVARTGRVRGRLFLNSEADYRDQRNLTVAISPFVADQLARSYGAAPDRFLRGRRIEVSGTARRERINFFDHRGRPTGLYYYQTHVAVTRPDQIRIVE